MLSLRAAGIVSTVLEAILYGMSREFRSSTLCRFRSAELMRRHRIVRFHGGALWVHYVSLPTQRAHQLRIGRCRVCPVDSRYRSRYMMCTPKDHFIDAHHLQEMGVNTTRLYQGFLTIGPSLPNGPEEYFGDVSQTTFVVKSCLYNTQTLILDGIVVILITTSHSQTYIDGTFCRYTARTLYGRIFGSLQYPS